MNFTIFKVSSLNLLLLHLQIPLYIPALIIVTAFYMVFQSILFVARKKYKTLARIVTRTSRSSHIIPLLKSLHWLPVKYCINFKLCCITHCTLSLEKPHDLNSLLIPRLNPHSLCSSSFNPLMLPFFNKMSNGFSSFAYAAPFLWNHLPNTFCSAPTYLSFKKNLKTYFFNQAFPT